MDYQKLLEIADNKKAEMNEFNMRRKAGLNGRSGSGPDMSAIAAFKARKEREERERLKRAQFEKERLLSLRAQNSKSLKASKMMQMRTKDNDFSKIVVTSDQLEEQKRVDEKIQRKGIIGTKERMKARIKMDEKLAGLRGKDREKAIQSMEREEPVKVSVTKPKLADIINRSKEKSSKISAKSQPAKDSTPTTRRKPQQPKPPTLSYDQLLNLASEKAKNKPSLRQEIENEISSNNRKLNRPMTQKEKDSLREEQFYKSRVRDAKLPGKRLPEPQPPTTNRITDTDTATNYQPSSSSNLSFKRKENGGNSNSERSRLPPPPTPQPPKSLPEPYKPKMMSNGGRQPSRTNQTEEIAYVPSRPKPQSQPPISQCKPNLNRTGDLRTPPISAMTNYKSNMPPPPIVGANSRVPASKSQHQQQGPIRSQVSQKPPRPPPSSSQVPSTRGAAPARPYLPPIGANYRRGIYDNYEVNEYQDDDDEYDDEEDDDMADFIDDGPEIEDPPEEEYSRAIREIFGYDKRKYRNIVEDDEDDIEEASFSQCMKEEKHSLIAGIKEDLEDIRREEEEKKDKMLRKKTKLK